MDNKNEPIEKIVSNRELGLDFLAKKFAKGKITWEEIPEDIRNNNVFIKGALIENFRIYPLLPAERAVLSDIFAAARVGGRIYVNSVLRGECKEDISLGEVSELLADKYIQSIQEIEKIKEGK